MGISVETKRRTAWSKQCATWLAAIVVVLVSFAVPAHASACTKLPFSGTRGAHSVHFVASALPDTVFTGAGSVTYRVAPGHFGPVADRAIHGQVVRVERVGSGAPDVMAGSTEAVLVPWDYDPACVPVPWTRSARWIEADGPGLYIASLRDPDLWANGIPTFDIHDPGYHPYPHRFERNDPRFGEVPTLSIDELFDLYNLLPTSADLNEGPEEAVQPLLAWGRAHPELATQYPANGILRDALNSAEYARVRTIESPLAGTYRVEVRISDRAPEILYLRTYLRATSGWRTIPRPPSDPDPDPVNAHRYHGYYLATVVAGDPADLPPRTIQGYPGLAEVPETGPDGVRSWVGAIDFRLLTHLRRDDPEVQRLIRVQSEDSGERYRTGVSGAHATFTLGTDGIVRVQEVFDLSDGTRVVVEGERISTDVVSLRPVSD